MKTCTVENVTLERMAAHLGALSDDALYIEHIVAQLVANRQDPITPTLMRDLQRMDQLSQSLRDLSRLVLVLSVDDQDKAVAMASLKLAVTRGLLIDAPSATTHPSGVVDLF